jgi:hypothetical protein
MRYRFFLIQIVLVALFTMDCGVQTPAVAEPKDKSPQIIEMIPENDARELDPNQVKELRIKFDRDMKSGMIWSGNNKKFPKTSGKPKWVDNRTVVYPVRLEKGKTYVIGINLSDNKNFQSIDGFPVKEFRWSFSTVGSPTIRPFSLKSESMLDLLPPMRTPENDLEPLPEGLLARIQKTRRELKSAEYKVRSVYFSPVLGAGNRKFIEKSPQARVVATRNDALGVKDCVTKFRFQGERQWFIDFSEIPSSKSALYPVKVRYFLGSDELHVWHYFNQYETYDPKDIPTGCSCEIRSPDIINLSWSFLDPFSCLGVETDKLEDHLVKQGIRYLGEGVFVKSLKEQGKFTERKTHVFGYSRIVKQPQEERGADPNKEFLFLYEFAFDTKTLLPVYSRQVKTQTKYLYPFVAHFFEIGKINDEYSEKDFRLDILKNTPCTVKTNATHYTLEDGSNGVMNIMIDRKYSSYWSWESSQTYRITW